jgi:hypothetical protein
MRPGVTREKGVVANAERGRWNAERGNIERRTLNADGTCGAASVTRCYRVILRLKDNGLHFDEVDS